VQIVRERQQSCQQRVGEKELERHRLGLWGDRLCLQSQVRRALPTTTYGRFRSAVPAVTDHCLVEGTAGDVSASVVG